MKPPTSPMRDAGLVFSIISTSPGQTIPELALSSGLWTHELASITRYLAETRAIEHRDGRLYVRAKKKPAQPSRWARLLTWITGRG